MAKAIKSVEYGLGTDFRREVWEGVVAVAEKHYVPREIQHLRRTRMCGY